MLYVQEVLLNLYSLYENGQDFLGSNYVLERFGSKLILLHQIKNIYHDVLWLCMKFLSTMCRTVPFKSKQLNWCHNSLHSNDSRESYQNKSNLFYFIYFKTMILLTDDSSAHVAHAWRQIRISEKNSDLCLISI